jgi:GT2 family glycosyltransferase
MKAVRIVIVNYRTPALVIDCLRSLEAEVRAEGDCQVVVVENASGDGSAEKIGEAIRAEGWDGWAVVLPVERNLGFAGGNNAALRPILAAPQPPDYVLLLNPDTVVRPGAVRALIDFMERHPDVGIAGSRLEDPDGTPQRSAFRFPSVASEFEGGVRFGFISRLLHRYLIAPPVQDQPHPTDWVAGASMIVRHAVFDAIGLMDEAYFLYFEEVDFCLRACRGGWPCWYVPASHVVHLVGQSSGVTDTKRPARRVPRYWFESRRRYFQKHHGRFYALLADLAWALGFALWRLRLWVQRKPDNDPPHFLWDFIQFNFLTVAPLRGGPP